MADQSNAKNALAIGVLLGLAAAGLGAYTMANSKFEKPGISTNGSKVDAEALTADAVRMEAAIKQPRVLKDEAAPGALVDGKPRLAPLFFAPELWQVSLDAEKKNAVLDIYDPEAPKIHPPVENSWFVENGLVEALGQADGLDMDSDGDGFTNQEEYAAKTKPNDAGSYPDLVSRDTAKFEVVSTARRKAIIWTDGYYGDINQNPENIQIKLFARPTDALPYAKFTVKPGEKFGLGGKDDNKERFTLVGFSKAPFSDSTNPDKLEKTFIIHDNEAAEGAGEFAVRFGRPRANEKSPAEARGHALEDVTVTLHATAGPLKDKPEGRFKVRLNCPFTIPGSQATCRIVSVDRDGSANLLKDGMESPVNVPKVKHK